MATSVDAKLLKQTKFPPEFNQKVDMQKVNVEVMKKCAHSPLDYLNTCGTDCNTGGSLARSPRYSGVKMM